MAGVLTYAQETALSRRVREWEEKIKPKLVHEVIDAYYVIMLTQLKMYHLVQEHHPAFDIHMYGACVIDEFQKRNCRPSKTTELEVSYSVNLVYYSLDEGQLQFQDIVQNKQPFEISRTFAATLQLVSLEKIDELRGITKYLQKLSNRLHYHSDRSWVLHDVQFYMDNKWRV